MSQSKKILFYILTVSLPLLVFLGMESTLRFINYPETHRPFLPADQIFPDRTEALKKDYYMVNPELYRRYTPKLPQIGGLNSMLVSHPYNVFQKEKPKDGFRVFVLGGSSAAGLPYTYNVRWSERLRMMLEDAMPDRTVEVVNLGGGGLTSFAVYDQLRWVIPHSPDAVLIYSGHNEYQKILGSNNLLSASLPLKLQHIHLHLQDLKTYQLIQKSLTPFLELCKQLLMIPLDAIGWIESKSLFNIRSAPMNSFVYRRGINQFQSNLRKSLRLAGKHEIPVYIGSLVSNLEAPPPALKSNSVDSTEAYRQAKTLSNKNENDRAREIFTLAKDRDPHRVRAPSEFNRIIRSQTAAYKHAHLVSLKEVFTQESRGATPGDALFNDYVHPNSKGQFLFGKSYFQALTKTALETDRIDRNRLKSWNSYRRQVSRLPKRIAQHITWFLKKLAIIPLGDNPYPRKYPASYEPRSKPDELAFKVVSGRLSQRNAFVRLTNFYQSQKSDTHALDLCGELRKQEPWSPLWYRLQASLSLKTERIQKAEKVTKSALKQFSTLTFKTLLASVQLREGKVNSTIETLNNVLREEPNNPRALYILSVAYLKQENVEKSKRIIQQLEDPHPDFPGIEKRKKALKRLRE